MTTLEISLLLATLLCALVAGFVFAFAVVVMPGIKGLSDREYLVAFKNMDRVVQNNHPLFIAVWLGSAVTLLASTVVGFFKLEGVDLYLLVFACATYLLGVQVPTALINIPLNNALQSQALDEMTEAELREARSAFEGPWVRWNSIRTAFATLSTGLLILLLLRL